MAAAAEQIKAKSLTVDGEAVVLRPDGLPRFEELSRRQAAHTAIISAFDLIEHDGEDMRNIEARIRFKDTRLAATGGAFPRRAGLCLPACLAATIRNAATAAGVWLAARKLLTRRFRVFRGRRQSNLLVDFAPPSLGQPPSQRQGAGALDLDRLGIRILQGVAARTHRLRRLSVHFRYN
jgi:hypothetical protein